MVQRELLDTLPFDNARAVRSRRDLRRVNGWMRNHAIMAGALKNNLNGLAPKQITELGAGDGDFLLHVAQRLGPFGVPPSGGPGRLKPELQAEIVNATLLDLQKKYFRRNAGRLQESRLARGSRRYGCFRLAAYFRRSRGRHRQFILAPFRGRATRGIAPSHFQTRQAIHRH
jgi:hypothetical protein